MERAAIKAEKKLLKQLEKQENKNNK